MINTDFYQRIADSIQQWVVDMGIGLNMAVFLRSIIILSIIAILGIIIDFVFRKIIVSVAKRVIQRTKNTYDDIILERKVFDKLSHIAPALVIYILIPFALPEYPKLLVFIKDICFVWIAINILLVVTSFIEALHDIYQQLPMSQNKSIKGYVQLVKIILYIIAFLTIISILFSINMTRIFTGLGAMAAVLILVFKDTILGFTASVQLSSNNMIKPGDWISMPKYNADGTVIELTLNTVKVQNWDKTISTIPTYALVADSFQNWRGMEESGGRRIKRSINIDMTSVGFVTPEQLQKFKTFKILNEYIGKKEQEITDFNKKINVLEGQVYNGRHMTNLGTFRKYLELYLKQHPKIHTDMTLLVRHLQPTEKGIPIEVYAFSSDQEWAKYESIQADIFDHILAILPEFGLKIFQIPTGSDFKMLKN
jgi:miniconductance mechanosensitive channel